MNFFERRHYRKYVKHLLHEGRHAVHMREDVVDEKRLNALDNARVALTTAWEGQDVDALDAACERMGDCIMDMYPTRSFPRFRENVEILVVALAVAMGFRTYFIQPFKIPTGSMQPTLNGITYMAKASKTLSDRFPLNVLKVAVLGRKYVEVRARASGKVLLSPQQHPNHYTIFIHGIAHEIPRQLVLHFDPQETVTKGQVLATGERKMGDHIFVDKVRYNFSRPRRGDIIVFDTTHIDHPDITPNSFYIKRCAGLPGEVISINVPADPKNVAERYLVADGRKIDQPYGFWRLLNAPGDGYEGYTVARGIPRKKPYLRSAQDKILLGDDEYLPLGDNTLHSLDGRYFGAVNERDLVGPAFAVYWPLSKRWGRIQ